MTKLHITLADVDEPFEWEGEYEIENGVLFLHEPRRSEYGTLKTRKIFSPSQWQEITILEEGKEGGGTTEWYATTPWPPIHGKTGIGWTDPKHTKGETHVRKVD